MIGGTFNSISELQKRRSVLKGKYDLHSLSSAEFAFDGLKTGSKLTFCFDFDTKDSRITDKVQADAKGSSGKGSLYLQLNSHIKRIKWFQKQQSYSQKQQEQTLKVRVKQRKHPQDSIKFCEKSEKSDRPPDPGKCETEIRNVVAPLSKKRINQLSAKS